MSDPEFYKSMDAFRAVVEKLDPGRLMANEFLERVVGVKGST